MALTLALAATLIALPDQITVPLLLLAGVSPVVRWCLEGI